MSDTDLEWSDDRDDDWADTFTWHAAWATAARKDDIRGWLEIVHEAVADSGSTAEELFGPPRDAAETFAQDLPAEQRAAGELDADTWWNLPRTLVLMTGWFSTALGIALLASDGWTLDLTVVKVAVLAALTLGGAGSGMAMSSWSAGRPGATSAWAVGSLLGVCVTIYVAMEVLDGDRTVATVPTLVLPGLGVALLVLWWALPDVEADVDDRSRSWPPARWFARLEWVLRGRHKVPRETARRLAAEARAHSAETGEHPFETFGPPQVHALALADADLRTTVYRERSERRWHLLFAGFAAVAVVVNVADGSGGWSAWVLAGAGLLSFTLALRGTPHATS